MMASHMIKVLGVCKGANTNLSVWWLAIHTKKKYENVTETHRENQAGRLASAAFLAILTCF